MKPFYLLILPLALALFPGCSCNPVTGKKELHFVSESQEINLGEAHYLQMQQAEGGPYLTHLRIQSYVQEVGMKLAKVSDRPDLPYEFTVLNNSIPNAWALPGGKIAVNRGLLDKLHSEGELAAVLAHEIVHSAARHGAKQMERGVLMSVGLLGLNVLLDGHKYEDAAMGSAALGATLVTFKYSRHAEFEADAYGMKYMSLAGYDPQAAVELQKMFVQLSKEKRSDNNWLAGLFASHPPSEQRVKANEKTASQYPTGGFIGQKEYAKEMAPLLEDDTAYADLDAGYQKLKENQADAALKLAEAALKVEPREAHLYNLKGKALLRLGHPADALIAFNGAIALNPDYFDFYVQRGLLERESGHLKQAREDLEKSLTLLPTADAHYALGMVDLQEGNRWQAIDHFKIASQANCSSGLKAREMLHCLGY